MGVSEILHRSQRREWISHAMMASPFMALRGCKFRLCQDLVSFLSSRLSNETLNPTISCPSTPRPRRPSFSCRGCLGRARARCWWQLSCSCYQSLKGQALTPVRQRAASSSLLPQMWLSTTSYLVFLTRSCVCQCVCVCLRACVSVRQYIVCICAPS